MDDDEAVRLCQDGEPDAFRFLVERYGPTLHGTAFLMTRDATATEELVQDALLSAWRGIGGFRVGEPVKPWLARIVVNTVLAHQRKHSLPTMPIDGAPEPRAADGVADEVEARDSVARGLATLETDQRQALLLRYYADLSVPEIAEVLGCPEGTVKSRMHRALVTLKSVIGE